MEPDWTRVGERKADPSAEETSWHIAASYKGSVYTYSPKYMVSLTAECSVALVPIPAAVSAILRWWTQVKSTDPVLEDGGSTRAFAAHGLIS